VRNHSFVFQHYIEVVLDNSKQDQYHDSNHDRVNNRTDQVYAKIYSEDILLTVLKYPAVYYDMMVHRLACRMKDRLSLEVAKEHYEQPMLIHSVLKYDSSPDLEIFPREIIRENKMLKRRLTVRLCRPNTHFF
jgi:hypothetical protein